LQSPAARRRGFFVTGFGLGHLLQYGRELSAMDQVVGVMVVIVVIGLIADKIFSP
jgi:NitT/TauT family transport system permease protein